MILTQGKVHYDLLEHRDTNGISDTSLLRIEQLHPLPIDAIKEALSPLHQGRAVPCGCRKSPATWAPGRTSSRTCNLSLT